MNNEKVYLLSEKLYNEFVDFTDYVVGHASDEFYDEVADEWWEFQKKLGRELSDVTEVRD